MNTGKPSVWIIVLTMAIIMLILPVCSAEREKADMTTERGADELPDESVSDESVSETDSSLHLVFFSPAKDDDAWWLRAEEVVGAVCDDLNIRLTVKRAARSRGGMVYDFKELLEQGEKIDAILFQSLKKNGAIMLQMADDNGIPAFIFNAGLSEEDELVYGKPREYFGAWIGQMTPDDEMAGYQLAKILAEKARAAGMTTSEGVVKIAGFAGNESDMASILRVNGLMRAVEEDPQLELVKLLPAQWDREYAKEVGAILLSSHSDINVVWAANDPMGLGFLDAMEARGLVGGQDILVGSVDWIDPAIDALVEERLSVSMGGHFMECAWSVIMIYDYLTGNDFNHMAVVYQTTMEPLTAANADLYREKLKSGQWDAIDFTRFSRTLNPDWKDYEFSLENLFAGK